MTHSDWNREKNKGEQRITKHLDRNNNSFTLPNTLIPIHYSWMLHLIKDRRRQKQYLHRKKNKWSDVFPWYGQWMKFHATTITKILTINLLTSYPDDMWWKNMHNLSYYPYLLQSSAHFFTILLASVKYYGIRESSFTP